MVNQGTIVGRVGKIGSKTTNGGVKIVNLSMVTSKKFIKNGEKQEKTTWHNVTTFSKLAEIAEQYVSVGDMLYIQGEMDNHKWTDQNNIERTKSFIIAHDLQFMPRSKERTGAAKEPVHAAEIESDDIPW